LILGDAIFSLGFLFYSLPGILISSLETAAFCALQKGSREPLNLLKIFLLVYAFNLSGLSCSARFDEPYNKRFAWLPGLLGRYPGSGIFVLLTTVMILLLIFAPGRFQLRTDFR
jgi:hypothetical protein